MYIIITLAISVILFYVRSSMDRISKSVLILYLLVWFLALALSLSGVYGLHQPRVSTIMLLLGHIFTFIIGFNIVKVRYISCSIQSLHLVWDENVDEIISSKIFKLILGGAFVYVGIMFVHFYQSVMLANALVDVRNDFYSGELLGEGFSFMNTYFLISFQGFILAIFGYLSFYKRNWIWFISGLYIIMYSLLSAGRNEIVNILLILVFFTICGGKLTSSNKTKNYIIFTVLIVLTYLAMGVITGNRSNMRSSDFGLREGLEETNSHIVSYLGGPVVAFDYALNSNMLEECGGYQYGTMTFASIDEMLFMVQVVLKKISGTGVLPERAINKIGTYLHENYIDVGTEWRWNALYTSCLYYYLDFGILGVLLTPFVFGIMVRLSIRWLYQYRSFVFLILLSVIFYILINTFQRFFLYRMSQILFLIGLYYFGRKNLR